jgi:hypothetical protein
MVPNSSLLFMTNFLIEKKMGYINRLERGRLLNYFNIDNMDIKRHMFIYFSYTCKFFNAHNMDMKRHMMLICHFISI